MNNKPDQILKNIQNFFKALPLKIKGIRVNNILDGLGKGYRAFLRGLKKSLIFVFHKFLSFYRYLKSLERKKLLMFGGGGLVALYLIGFIITAVLVYWPTANNSKNLTKVTGRENFVGKIIKAFPLPAAMVNNHFIPFDDFAAQSSFLKHFNSNVPDSLSSEIKDEKSLRKQVLDTLVETELINQQAEAKKLSVTKKEID
jgi:hypothetical protein